MPIRYTPNTAIPSDLPGAIKFLRDELDKIALVIANLNIPEVEDNPDPEEPWPTPEVHNELTHRDAADAHPMSAITDLLSDQARQDNAIFANTQVFFQPDEPDDGESSPGDLWFVDGYQ